MSFELTKVLVGTVASLGAASIVGNTIKLTTPDNLKTGKKIGMIVGGVVLSSLVGSAASKHVSDEIDEGVTFYHVFKDGISKARAAASKIKDTPTETSDSE